MPSIEIPESLFARLQKLAAPLVDTPVTVIELLLRSYEAQTGHDAAISGQPGSRGARSYSHSANLNPERFPAFGTRGS